MTTALKQLKIDRVAIVDRPANPEAVHVLAKRADDEIAGDADAVAKATDAGPSRRGKRKPQPMPPRMTDDMVSDPDVDEDDDETMAGDMDHDMAKAAAPGEPTDEDPDPDDDGDDDRTAAGDTDHDYHKRATKETATMTAPAPAPAATETEAVTKADLEAIRKQYEDQLAQVSKNLEETTARAVQAESVAKAEADARETRDAIAKAERDYPLLPGTTPAETGALVRAIGKAVDAETAAKVETLLTSASAAIAKGDLFAEHGRNGGAAADGPVEKLEAIAKGLRATDGTLTGPQAMAKAMEQHPELAAEHRKQFAPAGGYANYR